MMQRILSQLQEFFSMHPVENAWKFGVFARSEETAESNVDILSRYTRGINQGLFGICELTEKLEDTPADDLDMIGLTHFGNIVADY